MSEFTIYESATGKVLFSGSASTPDSLLTPGTSILIDAKYEGGFIADGEHHVLPTQPSPYYIFDYSLKQWVDPRTLADLKEAKWLEIKAARDAAEFGSFTWDNSTFDSDPTSQSRIQGAAQLATLALMNSQPFSIEWTLADNTVRTLSATDMLAVGTAMGVHISTQHALSRIKRNSIDAATTVDEVSLITW